MGIVPLFRVASRGEVRPKGGPLAPDFKALGAWFERYIATNPAFGLRYKTVANYRRTIELVRVVLGDAHPSNHDVLEWTLCLARPPFNMGSGTVYLHWKNLRAIYRYGADGSADVVSGNPCAQMKLARPKPTLHAVFNIAELWPTLLDAMPDERARAFLAFERYVGRRPGEVIGLMYQDIARERDGAFLVTVRRQRPRPNDWYVEPLKNATHGERTYPVERRHALYPFVASVAALGPAAVRIGRGGQSEVRSPFVFPYRGHELAGLMVRLRAVAPLAFPPRRAWRTFRHTLALELNRCGANDADVAEMLGSSAATIRETYIGLYGARVRASVMDFHAGASPPEVESAAGEGPRRREKRSGGARNTAAPVGRSTNPKPQRKETMKCPTKHLQRSFPTLALQPVSNPPRRGRAE